MGKNSSLRNYIIKILPNVDVTVSRLICDNTRYHHNKNVGLLLVQAELTLQKTVDKLNERDVDMGDISFSL